MRNVESSEFSLNIFYSEVLVHSLRSDWLLIWNWLFIYFHFFPLYNYSRPAPTKDNLCSSSKVFEFDNVYFIKLGWQNWFKRTQEEKRRSKAAAAAAAAAAPPSPPPPPPVHIWKLDDDICGRRRSRLATRSSGAPITWVRRTLLPQTPQL